MRSNFPRIGLALTKEETPNFEVDVPEKSSIPKQKFSYDGGSSFFYNKYVCVLGIGCCPVALTCPNWPIARVADFLVPFTCSDSIRVSIGLRSGFVV